jgi:molybdate transport system permease protein
MMSEPSRIPRAARWLAAIAAILLVLPLVGLVQQAPWSRAASALSSSGAWTALRLSAIVSIWAAVLAMVLGVPLGWVIARGAFRGRSVVRAIAILPLVLPPVVGGIGLLAALGRSGLVGSLLHHLGIQLTFSTAGAVVASTFVSVPLVVLSTEAGLRSLDPRFEMAAAVMGSSPGRTFIRVTLPMLRPQLVAGLVLAWARALGEFGATITFAGNLPGRTQTLPLAAYQALQTDPGAAVVTSLLLVAVSLVVLISLRGRLLNA